MPSTPLTKSGMMVSHSNVANRMSLSQADLRRLPKSELSLSTRPVVAAKVKRSGYKPVNESRESCKKKRSYHKETKQLGVVRFGSEPWFEPEPGQTWLWSSPRFMPREEPDWWSSSKFGANGLWHSELVRTPNQPSVSTQFHAFLLTSRSSPSHPLPLPHSMPFSPTNLGSLISTSELLWPVLGTTTWH